MGGFLGIGGSSYKTDRGAQLGARNGEWNIYNWGMPQGQRQQAQGQTNIAAPEQYFKKLLTGGRSDYTQLAAPAVNAATDAADATKRQEAAHGTARTGGTAAANREATTNEQKQIDDIINQAMVTGRQAGAQGLESIGDAQLTNAANLMGLSQQALRDITAEATSGFAEQNNPSSQYGQMAGALIGALPML